MKSKKIIVSIVICLVIAVFVVPSSSSYLSEVTISGEKKKGYSFYKSISISNKLKDILNTHKPQVCYKHVFNKFLLNSIRNKEQTKIKKTVSADYGYSKKILIL